MGLERAKRGVQNPAGIRWVMTAALLIGVLSAGCVPSGPAAGAKTGAENAKGAAAVQDVESFVAGRRFRDMTAEQIDAAVRETLRRFDSAEERVRAIALFQLGTPYAGGPLGEEGGADADPLFSLEKADCTALVLTSEALARGGSAAGARDAIRSVNYRIRPGDLKTAPLYSNRLHFTTDRLDFTPYDEDITASWAAGRIATREREVTLNRVKDDGRRLLDIDWERPRTVRYAPVDRLTAEALASLPKTAGVAFVKEKMFDLGLDVVHEGLLLDGRTLLHAGSLAGEVTKQPFLPYLKKDDGTWRYDGIVVYRFK